MKRNLRNSLDFKPSINFGNNLIELNQKVTLQDFSNAETQFKTTNSSRRSNEYSLFDFNMKASVNDMGSIKKAPSQTGQLSPLTCMANMKAD